ncbi:MAG TPA: protein tyrosine phosphatase family protein [Anaerolineales bacterium]
MLEEIYHFLALNESLFTGGMPTALQLADAAAAGVQVVINLATPDSERALKHESSIVEGLGMQYIGIPVAWDHPRRQDLDDFMDAMDAHKDARLLVHCQANYRVTSFVALYRVLRLGWDPDLAFQDVYRIWNPDEYPAWRKFIEQNLSTRSHRPESEAGP